MDERALHRQTDMMTWVREDPRARARASAATALGRIGRPEDVAEIVAFLVSPDARWVTGRVLEASGCLFLRRSV
jgi:3-oxoacyl-[acyl-carrier protein] reductase